MLKLTFSQLKSVLNSPLGNRELGLDVVRGVAILLAIGWHLAGQPTGNPISGLLLAPSRTFGWAGVDLFFVLSGFLVGRLILTEQLTTSGFDGVRFLARRAFKLWPVYYLFVALLILDRGNASAWNFLPHVLHVQNYAQTQPPHLWSLAVEEHFYLALALIAPMAFRRGIQPKTLLTVAAALMTATLAGRVLAWQLATAPVLPQQLTHFRIDALLAGVILAIIAVHYPHAFNQTAGWKKLWLAGSALGVWWLCQVPKSSALGTTIGYSISYLGSASFLLLLYRAAWVQRWSFLLRPIGFLGVYSYAIYLTHVSVAHYTYRVIDRFLPSVETSWLRLPVIYATVVAAAVILTRLVEWPALKLRNRLLPSHPKAPVGTKQPQPEPALA